jgi:hypothetical protein
MCNKTRFHFALGVLLLAASCTKKKTDNTPIPIPIDYSTQFSAVQSVTFSRPLVLGNLHPESVKILKLNGKYQLVAAYADLYGTTYDYFRNFELDSTTGKLTENTVAQLGEYKEVGFPKSPFFYEDLNGDGIKDLFEVDHGKETPSLMVNGQFPGYENHLFLGTADGKFVRSTVNELTTIKRFYHNAAVGDLDNDGDNDLIVQVFANDEMYYFKNTSGLARDRIINPGNSTGAVLIQDIDADGTKDIIAAPYIDRGTVATTRVLKVNLTPSSYTTSPLSGINPFGAGYGCFKLFSLPNPTVAAKNNIFYLVEGSVGDQKIFRSSDPSLSNLENINTKQNTYQSNGIRDYQLIDLNMDGLTDIFFSVNPGVENLNQRVWINLGNNIFENPSWEIDANQKDFFSLISVNTATGRSKFLYCTNTATPTSRIVDVYTKKR